MIIQKMSYNTSKPANIPAFKANLKELGAAASKYQIPHEYKADFTTIILDFNQLNELMDGTYYYRLNGQNPVYMVSEENPILKNLLQQMNEAMKVRFTVVEKNKTITTSVGDYFTKMLAESNVKQPEILVLGKGQNQSLS